MKTAAELKLLDRNIPWRKNFQNLEHSKMVFKKSGQKC